MNEFEIIERFFNNPYKNKSDEVVLAIGDDAAIIDVPEKHQLLISTDTLVSGVHFPLETSPENIAYKSLAVNLSDMAAMGATPRWVSLSLTVPKYIEDWFIRFAKSFNSILEQYSLVLLGGDTTQGPLSITIQINGLIPKCLDKKTNALKREGAKPGDLIYVTGKLGGAAFALKSLLDKNEKSIFKNPSSWELERLNRPTARIKTGIYLRKIASSCIDISDGLFGDLSHILKASKVGAEIKLANIPYSESLLKLNNNLAIDLALNGGDDYELCFTLPKETKSSVIRKLNTICPVSNIGKINRNDSVITLRKEEGDQHLLKPSKSYLHFN